MLEHLAKGLSFKDAARIEDISYYTVADHVKAIDRKRAVSSRGKAACEAIPSGLIAVTE